MLEYFVHLDKEDPPADLIVATAEVPNDLSRERVEVGGLPPNWREAAAPPELARLGDEFAQRGNHCILVVPSALAPSENNWLVNPQHPDYKKIAIHETEALNYDPRMFVRQTGHGRRKRFRKG
jgi:RES domain-containing protein